MRVYVQISDSLLPTLQDQARAAHRPPRYHLEWLIEQVLQAHTIDTPRDVLVPTPPTPPTLPPIERQRGAHRELVEAARAGTT